MLKINYAYSGKGKSSTIEYGLLWSVPKPLFLYHLKKIAAISSEVLGNHFWFT